MSRSVLPKGVFKMIPENFVVQEIMVAEDGSSYPLGLATESVIEGYDPRYPVTVFCMTKVGWDTKDALEEVARALGVPSHEVKNSSLKDKRAWTSQPISVGGPFRADYSHPTIHLVQMYGQSEHLIRGRGYEGNHFTINVRSDATELDFEKVREIENLWGRQRLGQPGSEKVGLALLEGRLNDACKLLHPKSAKKLQEISRAAGCSLTDALFHRDFAYNFGFEVEKWQSWLWNQLHQELAGANDLPERLPMWQPTEKVAEMYRHLWDPSINLHPKALNVLGKQRRPTIIRPGNFKAVYKNGMWRFEFDLPPSVYATTVLEEMFELEEEYGEKPRSR